MELLALKVRAQAFAASAPPKLRLGVAQKFIHTTVVAYWEHLKPRPAQNYRPCTELPTKSLVRESLELATALGERAAQQSVEHASYLIGSTYAAMLPDEYRAQHGVFYTPPLVVKRLLDAATSAGVNWSRCRLLDPACGGGAFLAPAANRMINALKGSNSRIIVRNVTERLHGYELDPFAAWLSLVFLEATLNETVGLGSDNARIIEVGDSLQQHKAGETFDLVIGNPPYGRVTLPAELRNEYKRGLYGHANLYGLFLDLAVRKAAPGGVVAYVTPTGFLCGEYFKRLRALLASHAAPISIDFVSERTGVFDDVLQETMLAVFQKGSSKSRIRVNFVDVSRSAAEVEHAGVFPLPTAAEQPWVMPRSASTTLTARRLCALATRLKDWGYGVSTGPLVWNRFKKRLSGRSGHNTVPLIWAEAVSADGSFIFRAARRNHAPFFRVEEGEEFLLLRKPCVLLQRTTAKEQARRLVAAALPEAFIREHGAVVVENHLNMLVPLHDQPAVNAQTLACFLNSRAADRAFRCISGTVAVSAYELEAMPLPEASALQVLTHLVAEGALTRERLDLVCDRLYGDR